MTKPTNMKAAPARIAVNKRARHDYFIEDTFEAGLALEGWEVKSLRAGRAQLTESYVHVLTFGMAKPGCSARISRRSIRRRPISGRTRPERENFCCTARNWTVCSAR
jgi:hypothetical protein